MTNTIKPNTKRHVPKSSTVRLLVTIMVDIKPVMTINNPTKNEIKPE
jgi:hypothetical protein